MLLGEDGVGDAQLFGSGRNEIKLVSQRPSVRAALKWADCDGRRPISRWIEQDFMVVGESDESLFRS